MAGTKDKRTVHRALEVLSHHSVALVEVDRRRGQINKYSLGAVFVPGAKNAPGTKNATSKLVAKIVTSLGALNATACGKTSIKKCTPTKDNIKTKNNNGKSLDQKIAELGKKLGIIKSPTESVASYRVRVLEEKSRRSIYGEM